MPPTSFILSVYPSSKGCGYVLFEGALSPFDWGITKRPVPGNRAPLKFFRHLILKYEPFLLVLEDWNDRANQRSRRIIALYEALIELAEEMQMKVATIPMSTAQRFITGGKAMTKREVALQIAKVVPAFSYQIPAVRRPWDAEIRTQALYDAATIGMGYLWQASGNDGGPRSAK